MGFGSMRVTARADRDAAIGVIRQTVELGVNHIDTAAFYFSPAASSAPARDLGVMPPS